MTNLKEACGVFGVYDFNHNPVYPYIYWGLIAQNHRGHQSHGILTYEGGFHAHKGLGLVPRTKSRKMKKRLSTLPGHVGIGNVRYMTSGRMDGISLFKDTQPTVAEAGKIRIAISYNGNIVNTTQLHEEASKRTNLEATSDTELICKKLCLGIEDSGDLSKAVETCLRDVEGAYSVVGITGDGEFFAFRDILGIKPLCVGFSDDKEIVAVSSETVGLDINDLDHFPETVKPGELLRVTDSGIKREQLIRQGRGALCSFEFAYFARPDSILNGTEKYVYEIRQGFGRNLGKLCLQKGDKLDAVMPVPETAIDAAYGFHEETGLPLEQALRRHRYVTDRAFITLERERDGILDKKINIMGKVVSGKRIALVDDSIVRGDTTKSVIQRMRMAGAKEVHVFATFPKIIGPCFYGIDMTTFSELIGFKRTPSEIAALIGADSVNYQKMEEFVQAIGLGENELCRACLTGKYPTPLAQKIADEKKAEYEEGLKEKGRIYE